MGINAISAWTNTEDQLIALGLERFFSHSSMLETTRDISEHLVVAKTPLQIRKRIRNQKRRKADDLSNPIVHFFKFRTAPRLRTDYHNFLPVLPPNVKLNCCSPDMLPQTWRLFFHQQSVSAEEPVETRQVIYPLSKKKSLTKAKSPLKKERDRILKKYSPLKRRKHHAILPKPMPKKMFPPTILPKPEIVAEAKEPLEEQEVELKVTHDDLVKEESTSQTTILDHALEECGIMEMAEEEEIMLLLPTTVSPTDSSAMIADQCSILPRRKNRHQKEAEVTLQMLQDETEEEEETRKAREATELMRFAETELGQEKYTKFLEVLVANDEDGVKSFMELHSLCQGYPEIQEMLLDLLTLEDSMQLGEEVYSQFRERQQQKRFFRKLRKCYENQQSVHNRILKEIVTATADPELSDSSLKSLANKLFRNNQHLFDSFLALIPQASIPESLLPEPELISFEDPNAVARNLEAAAATGGTVESSADSFSPLQQQQQQHWDDMSAERIELPPSAKDDSDFGGENCKCSCHVTTEKVEEGSTHCLHCSLLFLNGKMYVRDGKILKPVRIEYPGGDSPFQDTKKRVKSAAHKKRQRKTSTTKTAGEAAVATYGDNVGALDA